MENNNYHLTTGKTISDLVMYWGHNLNITKSPIVQNVFNKVQKLLKIKGIDDSNVEKALQNTDTFTMLLEAVDRVKTKIDEEIQDLFAKIMADNIENEGSFSIETVHRLAQMSKKDLLFFFNEVAPFCDRTVVHNSALLNKRNFMNLNIIVDTRSPTYTFTQGEYIQFEFLGGTLILPQSDVHLFIRGAKPLNNFGCELLKLQEIRKWTEEDKETLRKHFEKCGIKREDITFAQL